MKNNDVGNVMIYEIYIGKYLNIENIDDDVLKYELSRNHWVHL